MRRIYYILLCVLLCVGMACHAEETMLIGDVLSAETGDAIPNASVYLQGTKIGTATNDEGSFVLKADLTRKRVVVVSAVGYRTERFTIEAGVIAAVQIELKEQTAALSEVLALPGANQALPLLQAVREHRMENDRMQSDAETEAIQSTQLYISDIQRRHLERKLWRNLQSGMLPVVDSVRHDAGNEDSWLLPLYTSEKRVRLQRTHVQTLSNPIERAMIMTPTDYQALLTEDGNINFYDNEIALMGRSFLSPLARSGSTYYQYYLADSLETDEGKTYVVHFRTKNPFYETLNGSLYIDSATYALRAVEANVPRETQVNYLRGAQIRQSFAGDHTLADEQVQIVLDFAVKTDNSRTFPTVLIAHRLQADSTCARPVVVAPSAAIDMPGVETTQAMDSIENVPVIRFAKWMANIINTGYIPTGTCVDVGHIQEILQVNRTEGVHVGLPFRTNEKLWRNVSLEAAVGYGFRNQGVTGLGRVSVLIPALRRHLLVAEYTDHYVWPEVSDLSRLCYENGVGYHTMDFTSYALEAIYSNAGAKNTMLRQRQFQLRTENDWTDNLETELYLRVGNMGFNYQTIGGIVRLGWHERKVDQYMRRIHVRSHMPVLYLAAEMGSWWSDSYTLYGRLGVMLRQEADLGMGGTLDYALSAGYVIGKVPDLLLHHFEGNQGYAYDPYRFTLMNNGQFSAREYIGLHVAWNGQGVLFNLIPGIRYLRLRELVTMKLAYGGDLSLPYVELGCGIGNIFRVLDLHSVWRVTHRNDIAAPTWAMRFRFNIGL